MNKTKLTLPNLPDDATEWKVYSYHPVFKAQEAARPVWQRLIYRGLMVLHDAAESLWHWSYKTSRGYAPPSDRQTEGIYTGISRNEPHP